MGFLYRNKFSFPLISRKRVAEAVFLSVLDYGDVIYRHASAATLKQLDSVNHSAIRFIAGDSYSTHHCTLYSEVGWSSLSLRRSYHWYLFVLKPWVVNFGPTSPPYYSGILVPTKPDPTTWLTLRIPRVCPDLGKTAFLFDAPSTWNTLQQTISKRYVLPSATVFNHWWSLLIKLQLFLVLIYLYIYIYIFFLCCSCCLSFLLLFLILFLHVLWCRLVDIVNEGNLHVLRV